MTTLFHGSYTEVSSPLVKLGRNKVDFGQGFYLTTLQSQAEAWAKIISERRRTGTQAVVSTFTLDMDGNFYENRPTAGRVIRRARTI